MNHKELGPVLQTKILSALRAAGVDLIGVADISAQKISGLPRAIALGIAYDPKIVDKLDTDSRAFYDHLHETREQMKTATSQCMEILLAAGFQAYLPAISNNAVGAGGVTPAEISHKMCATLSGLGWVGKNALLVSPGHGCGLRLASVLTNAPLSPGQPVTESKCGQCRACAEVCPYGAIHGAIWHPGIPREELLDVLVCHQKREAEIPRLGYKPPCGLCIQVCPWSKKQ